MDTLARIEALTEDLKRKPLSADLDLIRSVLLEAHAEISNGLNRSQLGKDLQKAKAEAEQLKGKYDTATQAVRGLETEKESLTSNGAQFAVLFADLKKVAKGRAALAYTDAALILCTEKQIDETTDATEFLRIQATIDKDFKAKFGNPSNRIQVKSGQVIDPKPFISGG